MGEIDTDVRADMAHGRLEAAYDIVDKTAKEFGDQLDEADEARLADALDAIGTTAGSLVGSESIWADIELDDLVIASGGNHADESTGAKNIDTVTAAVGIKGHESGEHVRSKYATHVGGKYSIDQRVLEAVRE